MNVLPEGSEAPTFQATDLNGDMVSLTELTAATPVVLCFGMPRVNASRLVVGYLRRLKENAPAVHVLIVLQGEAGEVRGYAGGYLDGLTVIHDASLELSRLYGVTHVPSTYYLSAGSRIDAAFTGFSRPALNALAEEAAEATGAKAKQLITPLDNKGEYELAERGLSAEN